MKKKQQPIAVLEIKWEDGYFRSTIQAGANLETDQTQFVEHFCIAVNAILKNKGVKAPEIGILP